MKYMLMMQGATKANWETFCTWQKPDLQAHIAFMQSFCKSLAATGELVSAEGLDAPGQAVAVRAGQDGTPVTDGVFPEAKEFLMGYWIVEVQSPQRAVEIAARASAAPGPGGAPMNMLIEVRQVMSGPPEEFA